MAIDDGGERRGQIGQRVNGIELAGFDQGGDGRAVLRSSVMSREERVLPVQRNGPNGSLDRAR